MNVTFERATPADAEKLVKAQIAAFHDDSRLYDVEIGVPPGYDSAEVVLKTIQEDEYYKIVSYGQIIGGILVFDFGDGHLHLDRIYLDPDFHNRGIGTQAMQFIEQTYAANKWSLHTPIWAVRNRHFYEKIGYVNMGEEHLPDIILIAYEKQV